VFYLFIITISLVMKAYFRTIASIFSDPAPAQAVAGVTLLVLPSTLDTRSQYRR
jgi:ATP-binding cassette subfamily G (WHITE) protein 2 (SNQ2)